MNEYPNYMSFLEINYNDGETLIRALDFHEDVEGVFVDMESHIYESYGTYYPRILLKNNVSQIEMNYTIEAEQCVNGLNIDLTSER